MTTSTMDPLAITPEQFAEQIAKALPAELRCVVLYGSAAAGDFLPGASNYNLLVVAEPINTSELDRIGDVVIDWVDAGNPHPLFFTPSQLRESRDAFPIELLDIHESRRVLWGADLLAEFEIKPGDLRLQVERELTGKLLKLRARYVLAGSAESSGALMLHSLSTFLVLFRATLRLYQQVVPATKLEALHALARHIAFDVQTFERLYELKQQVAASADFVVDVSFDSYLSAIECVAQAVNQHGRQSPKENKP